MTRDERFLIQVYKMTHAVKVKDISPEKVGASLAYSERLIKNILRGLMQANFLRRTHGENIQLTEQGLELIKSLI